MSTNAIITSSREKSHQLLSTLFKANFGDLANLDKTSLNAWILERLTDIQRDLSISMTLDVEEKHLNSCKQISSARSIGYQYNFKESNSTPAKGVLSFMITLPIDFINKSLTISADTTKIYAEDITYLLPGDIEITSNKNRYIQAVRRTNHIFETSDNVILFSKSTIDNTNNVIYFVFATEVIQLDFVDSYFIVSDHLQLTNSINDIEFDNNFYKIDLYYNTYNSESTKTERTDLLEVDDLSNYSSLMEVFTTELVDSDKIRITLGDGLNGKYYAAGKEIKYRLFNTMGTDGNVINPTLNIGTSEDLSEYTCVGSFLENPTGGKNEYDLIGLKNAIKNKIQTSDNIITDNDLKNKLSEILGLSTEETFHKLRRNDPIERILDLFAIVKDRTQANVEIIVPTNTLDVELNFETIIENEYNTIKPFFLIEASVRKEDNGGQTVINKFIPTYRTKLDSNIYYSNYYCIKIQKNPLLLNFFNLGVNLNLVYENTYINNTFGEEVYINSAILERDIFTSDNNYNLRITLDALNQTFLKDNNLIIRCRFKNVSTDGRAYDDFFIEFHKAKNEKGELQHNVYESKITSLDIISNSNNLFIKNVFKLEQRFTDNTENWAINTNDFDTEMVDNLECEICIFYNYDTGNVISNPSFENIRDVRTKLLMSTYKIENMSLYQNVDEIIYCQTEYTSPSKENILIKSIPLYKEEYITDINNRTVLNKQMTIEKNIKKAINGKTEFPSRLSLKYFNTYGRSSAYTLLDNVALTLEFEISYKNNKIISSSELQEIKHNLIKFIDSINKKSLTEDRNIYISDLVSIVKLNQNIVQCRLLNFEDNIFFNKSIVETNSYTPTSLQLDSDNIKFVVKSI